jgi:TRAP-type C4-dicarboxylate transport system permease small subunit|tara:strand:+ start:125 stop:658 length:534 start_codon:yes stop_codon:yes gene_type:complete
MLLAVVRRVEVAQQYIALTARWGAYISAIGIFFIVLLLVGSSLKRYLFQQPIHVTEELGGLLFLATTFFGLTYGFVRNRHVRLELFWRKIPSPWNKISESIGYVLCIGALVILVRETWLLTIFSFDIQGKSVMTELLLWPWRLIIPTILAFLGLAIFVRLLITVLRLFVDESPSSDL